MTLEEELKDLQRQATELKIKIGDVKCALITQRVMKDVASSTSSAPTPPTPTPPVDLSARTLVDGSPVTDNHRELKSNGQQKDYVVLSAEERAKGFVRPVRRAYTHVGKLTNMVNDTNGMEWEQRIGGCGSVTHMSPAIAETYARCPTFYSGTFCVMCGTHLPLDEFLWYETNEQVGS